MINKDSLYLSLERASVRGSPMAMTAEEIEARWHRLHDDIEHLQCIIYGILPSGFRSDPPAGVSNGAVPRRSCCPTHTQPPPLSCQWHVFTGATGLLNHAVAAAPDGRLVALGFNFIEKPNVWRWAPCTAHATAPNHAAPHCTHTAA